MVMRVDIVCVCERESVVHIHGEEIVRAHYMYEDIHLCALRVHECTYTLVIFTESPIRRDSRFLSDLFLIFP